MPFAKPHLSGGQHTRRRQCTTTTWPPARHASAQLQSTAPFPLTAMAPVLYISTLWIFVLRGLDESGGSGWKSIACWKLSENPELVLTELCMDARSARCISKQRALGSANGGTNWHWWRIWGRACAAVSTAKTAGGGNFPAICFKTTHGIITLIAYKNNNLQLFFQMLSKSRLHLSSEAF